MSGCSYIVVVVYLLIIQQHTLRGQSFITHCYNVNNYQHCLSTNGYQLTWPAAKDSCVARNATLFTVTSLETQSMLEQFRVDVTAVYSTFSSGGTWINVFSATIDGFHWINGSTGTPTVDGQDAAHYKRFGAIGLNSDPKVAFNAQTWDTALFYVCQHPGAVSCNDGYRRNSVCYKKYNSETVTWFTASNRCLSMGGSLATFNDLTTLGDDRNLISWLNLTETTRYWIGLVQRWFVTTVQDGSVVDVQYTNWEPGNPSQLPDDNSKRCVALRSHVSTWIDSISCPDQQRFICQAITAAVASTGSSTTKTPTVSTSTGTSIRNGSDVAVTTSSTTRADNVNSTVGFGFITGQLAVGEFTTRCYSVNNYLHCLSTDGTMMSWQGAWEACRARNSTLLSVTSSEIQSVLRDFRTNVTSIYPNYDSNGMWANVATGVIDNFHWIEGTSGTLGEVQDQISDTRRFATIVISPVDNKTVVYRAYEWTDPSSYICQFSQDVNCADGYQRSSVCYLKYNNEPVTWFAASNRCLSMGGSLATFNDLTTPSDDSYLTAWLNIAGTTKYWIGLVRKWYIIAYQGGSVTDVQYTNWESGSPRGPDNINRCVLLTNTLQWSDSFSCTDQQRFACQRTTTANAVSVSVNPAAAGARRRKLRVLHRRRKLRVAGNRRRKVLKSVI